MAAQLTREQCVRATHAYRALRRAQRITFQGDPFQLADGYSKTRALFSKFAPSAAAASTSATAAPPTLSSSQVDEHIDAAFEIARILRHNVVQARLTDKGTYALRFTKDTERGDNESIKGGKDRTAEMDAAIRRASRRNSGNRRTSTGNGKVEIVQSEGGSCCGGSDGASPQPR